MSYCLIECGLIYVALAADSEMGISEWRHLSIYLSICRS